MNTADPTEQEMIDAEERAISEEVAMKRWRVTALLLMAEMVESGDA